MAEKNNSPAAALKKENLNLGWMENELEHKVELFSKITQTCYKNCIDKNYKEGELYIGENSCIDRCVSKYLQVTNLIGQLLASGGIGTPGIH